MCLHISDFARVDDLTFTQALIEKQKQKNMIPYQFQLLQKSGVSSTSTEKCGVKRESPFKW